MILHYTAILTKQVSSHGLDRVPRFESVVNVGACPFHFSLPVAWDGGGDLVAMEETRIWARWRDEGRPGVGRP